MERQTLYIPEYEWTCVIFYNASDKEWEYVESALVSIGANDKTLARARRNVVSGKLNTGLTYSDLVDRVSVVVIGRTSSATQFMDTYCHEKGHLVAHIGKSFGLDPYGEEIQYLSGYIGRSTFPFAGKYLCDHCRRQRREPTESYYRPLNPKHRTRCCTGSR